MIFLPLTLASGIFGMNVRLPGMIGVRTIIETMGILTMT